VATKRQILDRRRRPEISPEAVRLWRLCCEIERQGTAAERWEDDRRPGRRGEYLGAGKALCIATGLDWTIMIWPSDARSPTVPANLRHRHEHAAAYRAAWAVRCALEAADRESGAA
jgi:hypothetical protein